MSVPFVSIDLGWYEDVVLTEWGDATEYAAAAIVYDGHTAAYILEPEGRPSWDRETEERFREDVKEFANDWEEIAEFIVFDPARDNQEEYCSDGICF